MSQRAITSAAKTYARMWTDGERGLVFDLGAVDRTRRLGALQRCAAYFRIARNFPTRFDVERGIPRLAPVLAILDTVRPPLRADRLLSVVAFTSQRLASVYGKKALLSATTKLLWAMHKDPVIIYDSQVRTALGTAPGDYPGYVCRWHSLYFRHASGIRTAVSRMKVSGVPFEREWFQRRVFDLYLWAEGARV